MPGPVGRHGSGEAPARVGRLQATGVMVPTDTGGGTGDGVSPDVKGPVLQVVPSPGR